MITLPFYLRKLTHFKRATSKGEKAPHKPILLLAVLRLIETATITENKIYITPELVAAFKDTWHLLVTGNTFTANFSLPFYHLKSEGFWHLHTYPGREIILTSSNSIRSFGHLKDVVWYAAFDPALYELFSHSHDRVILRQTLLQTYFPAASPMLLEQAGGMATTITREILQEPTTIYRQVVAHADEEELFVRNGLFKKIVPVIYNHTCCISRMRIIATTNIQMIDACHIIPFSESHDCSIQNGLSLCPNLHRAFDRGLLAIGDDYRVMLSPGFTESDTAFSLRQYEGIEILLPGEKRHYPAPENTAWHRENIFRL